MASKMVRTKPNELHKVIKSLSKGADKALAKLLELVDSEDEKIAFSAAKTWLDTLKEMQGQVEKQELQILLVNAKISGPRLQGVEDNTPLVDFNNIQEIN